MMLINNNNFVLEQLMATDYNNDIQQSNEVVASIKGDVAYIKQEICNIKQELKLHTTKMNLNFDKIYDRLSAKKNCTCNCENAFIRQHNVTIPKEDLLKKYKFPLSSTADISKLDQEIRNNIEFKGQLVGILQLKLHYYFFYIWLYRLQLYQELEVPVEKKKVQKLHIK